MADFVVSYDLILGSCCPSINFIRDTWVLSGGLSCTSCGTFLNKKYSSCSSNSCDAFYALVVCAPRAWSPRVIRVDTLSHGQRDSKSLLWDLRIDRKTWLLQVERYFTCKAVLNYYYSVSMYSLVYYHFFLFLNEREIYLKGTWWWN